MLTNLMLALALILGAGAPAPAVPVEPIEIVESVVDPVMEADAYATYDYLGLQPNTNASLMLEYVMTVDWDTEDLLRGEFVLASRAYPGKFHVMRYTPIYFA